jgi:hypothetical protein
MALPDIDDDVFRSKLAPLAKAVVPGVAATSGESASAPAVEQPASAPAPADVEAGRGVEEPRPRPAPAALPTRPTSSSPDLATRIAALTAVEEVREARGAKKSIEFILPERVVKALKMRAAGEGVSMTVLALQAFQQAGYPVIEEDFVDLRKLPKR